MATAPVSVPDILGEHCDRAVTNVLIRLEDACEVTVDIPGKGIHASCDDANNDAERIEEAVGAENYTDAPVSGRAVRETRTQNIPPAGAAGEI